MRTLHLAALIFALAIFLAACSVPEPTGSAVIPIISAEHLDENRSFVADIYDEVSSLDDTWSPDIPDGHYVRVTFEENLTSERDITIYPRTTGSPTLAVYEENSDIEIARFTDIIDDLYNTVLLTAMTSEYQDTFDLRILDGAIAFDHIIDPTVINYTADDTFTVPAGVTEIMVEAWGAGGSGGAGERSGPNDYTGGGGAGGQYVVSNLTVSGGQEFTITVAGTTAASAQTGADTILSNASGNQVVAKGGAGGVSATTSLSGTGGLGSTTGGVGDTVNPGGSGGDGVTGGNSGGGGGGAGSGGAGGDATGGTAGTGTANNIGGDGGTGVTGNTPGNPGTVAGGGGSGGSRSGNGGGTGAAGYLRITYTAAASPPAAPTGVSATDGAHTDRVTVSWTPSDGATSYYVYTNEDGLIATLGDVSSYDHTSAPQGSITPGSAVASDGSSTAHVSLSVSGASTTDGATRTYYVVAGSAAGNSSNSATDTGYRGVGSLTYQWERSAADSDASYSSIGGATTATYDDTGAPSNGDGRYYRVVLDAAGAAQQTSTADRGFRSVETPPDAPTGVSATDGAHTDKVTVTWTKSSGATGYYVYTNEDGLIASLGDVDEYNYTSAPQGSITPGSAVASDGTSAAHVSLSVSGASTSNGSTRTYYVVATNSSGNSSNSATDTGYRGVGSLTYQWERSAADSDASYSSIGGATTATYDDTGAPVNGDGRYYRVVLNAAGAAQQTSTADRGFRDASPLYSTFDGATTDFSLEGDLSAVSQPILERVAFGRITWSGTVDARNQDFDTHVSIADNSIDVASASLHSSFNTHAEIRFYGLPYAEEPVLLKDGFPCASPSCNITSYSAGTLIANVSGFSEYTTSEASVGGQAWTVTAWVNIEDTGGTQYLVDGMNLGLFLVNSTSDRMLMYLNGGASEYTAYTAPGLLAGQGWKHVAFVFRSEGDLRRIYVNGADVTILGPNVDNTTFGLASTFEIGRNTVGMIDEFLLFNRSLSGSEIGAVYRAHLSPFQVNLTGLANGIYTYVAYSVDEAGNYNSTEMRTVTIDAQGPYWTTNVTNETGTTPRYNETIEMNLTLNSVSGLDTYTFSWNDSGTWVNDSPVDISGTQHIMSVSKQVASTRDDVVGWRVYFNDTSGRENISDVFEFTVKNTIPTVPVLDQLENESITINLTPRFNWTTIDVDSDPITHNITIECLGGCSVDNRNATITDANYTPSELAYFSDDGYTYRWRVQACDDLACSDWSVWNEFNLSSFVSIDFTQDAIDFSNLDIGDTNTTETDDPAPFVLANSGNVPVNVTYYADEQLYERAALPSTFFRAKVRDGNYTNATTTYIEIPSVSSPHLLIEALALYGNATIDLEVTVPLDEPVGVKTSTTIAVAVRS